MALYDRDYVHHHAAERDVARTEEQPYGEMGARSESQLAAFVKQTYQLFAASCLAATAGAYVGMGMAATIQSWYWGLVILEFALLFGLMFTRKQPGLNLIMLFGFTFMTGITLVPLLTSVLALPGGGSIVAQTFFLTAVITGGLSLFAMNTTRDFSWMGKGLFIALIVIIIASIINIFLGSPMVQVIIAGVGTLLFSGFILFDTQRIIRGEFATPSEAAVSLYLDVLNLFISLLQILGIFGREE
ncbi:Bax inhibitor-1/YccA family protein [Hydrogenimonas sp. SS33]|uniref:Bax inhibitor-1/YccA family protein n=1 Tax=Hydrogenimonas leucolamina TaxID=2954236 RepID=UPI00336C015F